MKEEEDGELIRRCQEGDTQAFDALFERYRRRVLAYVAGITKDMAAAEDITQDVFLVFVRRIRELDGRGNLRPWLFHVARNRSIDWLRHRRREAPSEDGEMGEEPAGGRLPSDDLERKEDREKLAAVLDRLGDKERDVIALRFNADLSFQEIADVLKRPLGTVLWQARHALERLREEWGRGRHGKKDEG